MNLHSSVLVFHLVISKVGFQPAQEKTRSVQVKKSSTAPLFREALSHIISFVLCATDSCFLGGQLEVIVQVEVCWVYLISEPYA